MKVCEGHVVVSQWTDLPDVVAIAPSPAIRPVLFFLFFFKQSFHLSNRLMIFFEGRLQTQGCVLESCLVAKFIVNETLLVEDQL